MKLLNSISNKYTLIVILTVVFWLGAALFFVDRINTVIQSRQLINEIDGLLVKALQLEKDLVLLRKTTVYNPDQDDAYDPGITKQFHFEITTILESMLGDPIINNNITLQRNIRLASESIFEINRVSNEYFEILVSTPIPDEWRQTGLTGELNIYSDQLIQNLILLKESYIEFSSDSSLKKAQFIIFFFIVAGILVISLLIYEGRKIYSSYSQISNYLDFLSLGKIPEPLQENSDNEIIELKKKLNSIRESLIKKIEFSEKIGREDIVEAEQAFDPDDELGNVLNKLANKLTEKKKEDEVRKYDEKKRSWINEGLAVFGEIFRSERDDEQELAYKVVRSLVGYLEANAGTIFLYKNDETNKGILQLESAFAYDRRKFLEQKIEPGVGLVGTCALEKETIFLTEIPEDYPTITSGLGEAPPRCLLLVPLKLENEIFGIIEIASFKILKDFEIKFVEQLGESIATSLSSVRINEKTRQLLTQSQHQAKLMERQEEEMRMSMMQLEKAQEESLGKESEIHGILNAVNASSLVAEFSLNGRFTEINDKFMMLLDSPGENILGKHHSDFAVVDKYSDGYKDFWRSLKEGKTITVIQQYRLFNGDDIWLDQTFSPVPDSSGKIYKILNISSDITKAVKQNEWLESQRAEIVRKNIELESLTNSVDTSLIMCEYSPDGIITGLNDKFAAVTGYSKKELLGKNNRIFLKDTEKDQFEIIMGEVMKEKIWSGVIRRTLPSGDEKWLMSSVNSVKDENGIIYKVYHLAQDITEKRLNYQLLEDANNEIERLKKRIKELE